MVTEKTIEEAKAKVKVWMEENLSKYDYGRAFDLAVDCAYDLELVSEELNDWEIPAYITDIAETFLPEPGAVNE